MKRLRVGLVALWAALLSVLAAPNALASVVNFYQFEVTQSTCVSAYSPGTCAISHDQGLNQMAIGVQEQAVQGGAASLSILHQGAYSGTTLLNNGIASFSPRLYLGTQTVSLDPATYFLSAYFRTELALVVAQSLSGGIYVNDGGTELVMATSRDALSAYLSDLSLLYEPIDPWQWTGFVRSDALGSYILPFTGHWRFVGAVPEPGTLALLLSAALALAWVAQRRRAQVLGRPMR